MMLSKTTPSFASKSPIRFAPSMRVIAFAFFFQGLAIAQQKPLVSARQATTLENFAEESRTLHEKNYQKALLKAQKEDLPLRIINKDGSEGVLVGLDGLGNLKYYRTHNNSAAAATSRTTSLYSGGALGLNLSGGSPQLSGKLAFWDGGAVLRTHQEFGDRVTQVDRASATSSHATHVAGTMMAAGLNALAKGMAFGANLRAFDFNSDRSEMSSEAANLLVSNHSYGAYSGWVFNARGRWEWWGDDTMSKDEDYKFGFYDEEAAAWDKIAYNAPYYTIVTSAGNEQQTAGPTAGVYYFLKSSTRDSSNIPRKQSLFYDLIDTKGNSKNILTIGAVSAAPASGVNSPADVRMSGFSSWGPTDDGRIKPDLVGVGVSLLSTTSTGNANYAILSGTSMSSPHVTGNILLLQELYSQLNDKQFMRTATVKALVCHTADEAGDNPGPDYAFGWGNLNAERAATLMLNKDQTYSLTERQLAQGEVFTQAVIASGKSPLVMTIAWTDPEAEATALKKENFNSRLPKLVNDLDLRISDGKTTFSPWILDPENPTKAATTGDNIRDNIEQIYIANPIPGRTYTFTISHKGTLLRGPQAYSVAMSGIGGKAYCTSNATNEADSKINQVKFGNINFTAPTACATFTDATQNIANVTVGQTLSTEITVGSCGVVTDKIVKVFIDWNADSDFDDANEMAATSGVLNGTATFKADIKIPAGVQTNALTRMRVVCVEGNDASKVLSCGTYTKGETQEFLVRFARPKRDVGVTALLTPEANFCYGKQSNNIAVTLKNFGGDALTNIPLRLEIVENTTVIATFSTTYGPSIGTLSEGKVIFKGDFDTKPGVAYTFRISTQLSDDQDVSNDLLTVSRTAASQNAKATGIVGLCDNQTLLRANGNGTVFWYDAPTGGNIVAVGSSINLSGRIPQSILYAGLNDMKATTGISAKSAFASGGYNQFTPSVKITTLVPLQLETARLYIGNAGRIVFTVTRDSDGVLVASNTLDVTPTRNPPVAGATTDDPADQGQIYNLNLAIPQAGNYSVNIAYENGATIYRNNNLTKDPYPIVVPNVMSITGNTATGQVGQFYYYFYDLKIGALGCAADGRTAIMASPVEASNTVINPNQNVSFCAGGSINLSVSNNGAIYQWFKDGKAITGVNVNTLSVREAGSYTVAVQEGSRCPATSTPVVVSTRPLPPRPAVSRTENVLTTTAEAMAYQWIFNDIPLANATQKSLTAYQSGKYALQITQDGCSNFSDDFVIFITAIEKTRISIEGIKVYPNPTTNGLLIVEYPITEPDQLIKISLHDLTGKTVGKLNLQSTDPVAVGFLDVSALPAGLYLLKTESGEVWQVKKVVKMD